MATNSLLAKPLAIDLISTSRVEVEKLKTATVKASSAFTCIIGNTPLSAFATLFASLPSRLSDLISIKESKTFVINALVSIFTISFVSEYSAINSFEMT